MPYEAQLHAIAPEDLSLLVSCYRPMDFLSRSFESPIEPELALRWLDTCAPLLERVGEKADEDLKKHVRFFRKEWRVWNEPPFDTDPKQRRFAINHNVHFIFQQLASDFLTKAARIHTSARFTFRTEGAFEAFSVKNLDHRWLVPGWTAANKPDRAHTFASSPITHSPFGRLYIWRSAEEVRAFFPEKLSLWNFWRLGKYMKAPSAQEVLEQMQGPGYESSFAERNMARSAVSDASPHWSRLVGLLLDAQKHGTAFISVTEDITDYD